MSNVVKSVQLFFQEGTSDKVYNATIVEDEGETYTVKVEWGRRGASLSQGTKAVMVTLEAAERAYDKVVRSKTKKGYQEITAAVQPAAVAPPRGEGSASRAGVGGGREKLAQAAQLLNNVDDDKLDALVADDAHVAQQKFDGMRIIAHVREEGVVATNRGGEVTALDVRLHEPLVALGAGTIVDGELVSASDGSAPTYWLFDALAAEGEDIRDDDYLTRYGWLFELLGVDEATAAVEAVARVGLLRIVPLARSAEQKRALVQSLRAVNAEGVVFKRSDAPYRAGRPASGGTQLKHKFVKSADVFIIENAGNAYRMAVFDDAGRQHDVGKVFAGTTNESRAELDAQLGAGARPVAEVRYLYATEGNALYQPVFVRMRDDKSPEQCLLSQLLYTDKQAIARVD
ncbi:MAG: WGR domain-containing protein [Myxococcales bacterium]|nr:WGR domain-containing protein [Myxococcales bacterium]